MARLVRLVPNVDYKKLRLTPAEGNVFSKIDGKVTDEDITRLTGMHADTVGQAIERLVELGAAEIVDKARLEKDQTEKTVKAAATLAFGGDLGKGKNYDPKLLSEEVDLELDKKKQILDAFSRLDGLNFYELLGLHNLVDKKEVKAAYYAIAPEFHPDKFFKRKLGSYKTKIEAVFNRLTLAHDTLTNKQKRAEYDEYLSTLEQNRKASALLQGDPNAIHAARAAIEQHARAAAAVDPAEAKRQAELADKKRALAAKLGGGKFKYGSGKAAEPQPAGPPPGVAPIDPRQAAEALRVRYEYAKQEAARAQVEHYLTSGRNAAAQNEWASAANFFRVAASLAPNDERVQAEASDINQRAAVALADGFARQGEFEIQQERWMEAAVSFSKACQGKPDDARVHERAAYATFRSGNNARRAVELARRAVELAPRSPQVKVTLAYCFMAAGFESSAYAELERALEVGGKDEKVVALVSAARDAIKAHMAQLAEQRAQEAQHAPLSARSSGLHPPAYAQASPPPAAQDQGRASHPSVQPGTGRASIPSMPAFEPQRQSVPPDGKMRASYPNLGAAYPGQQAAPAPSFGPPPQGGYPPQGYPGASYPPQVQNPSSAPYPSQAPQGYAPQAAPPPHAGYPQGTYPQPAPPPYANPTPLATPAAAATQRPTAPPPQGYGHGSAIPPAPPAPAFGPAPAPPTAPSFGPPPQPGFPHPPSAYAAEVHNRPTPYPGTPVADPEAPPPQQQPPHPPAPGSPRMSGAYSVVNPAVLDRRTKR